MLGAVRIVLRTLTLLPMFCALNMTFRMALTHSSRLGTESAIRVTIFWFVRILKPRSWIASQDIAYLKSMTPWGKYGSYYKVTLNVRSRYLEHSPKKIDTKTTHHSSEQTSASPNVSSVASSYWVSQTSAPCPRGWAYAQRNIGVSLWGTCTPGALRHTCQCHTRGVEDHKD